MTIAATGAKERPALDENSFQQLLAAAYIVQEHNEVSRAKNKRHEPAKIFSEITNIRTRIIVDEHDFTSALGMLSECLRKLTTAEGASICLVKEGFLRCVAFSGTAVKVPGGAVASNSLVATERLRNGRAFQSENSRSDIRLEPAMCLELQIGSLLAVPIERNQEIAGLIELRWKEANAFEDWDERICELGVGLIRELLDREFGPVSAKVAATDKAAAAGNSSEKLKPYPMNLEKLREESEIAAPGSVISFPVSIPEASPEDPANKCRVCGHAVKEKDDFCGSCGMLAHSTDDGMQSKWASMWYMQRAQEAVGSEQTKRDRMWPLEEIKTDNAEAGSLQAGYLAVNEETRKAEADASPANADQAQDMAAGAKRGPRGVLSVLKLHLKGRGIARKLSAVVFLALLKKFS